MATPTDIDNEIQELNEKWEAPNARNGLFGNLLKSIKVQQIRGMSVDVEFSWPVTAIAGTNGSGKTTLLQLCSSAYVSPEGGRNYKIGDWVRGALAGETPAFMDTSAVSFSFWNDEPGFSIPYVAGRTRWGYPRRGNPQRLVQFLGITTFAPRIERKDRLHVFRSQLEVKSTAAFTPELLQSISKVLGAPYPSGTMHTVGLRSGEWSDLLPQVSKGNCVFAEPHMGAGEQKVIRLAQALEALPARSLVLLEEPEITLHPDAQRGLAWYLMNLARRKGHQIIVTTHSADLFETLPPAGRVLLVRRSKGIEVILKPPGMAAARELASVAKSNKDLILVEDKVAREFVADILRRHDKKTFDNSSIVAVGNTDDVKRLVDAFRSEGVRAVGVRDGDVGPAPANHLFSLPGGYAPEILLLGPENIAAAEPLINGVTVARANAEMAAAAISGASQRAKAIFPALANEMGVTIDQLRGYLTAAWMNSNAAQVTKLVEVIRSALAEPRWLLPPRVHRKQIGFELTTPDSAAAPVMREKACMHPSGNVYSTYRIRLQAGESDDCR